jgi:hypothetical protein
MDPSSVGAVAPRRVAIDAPESGNTVGSAILSMPPWTACFNQALINRHRPGVRQTVPQPHLALETNRHLQESMDTPVSIEVGASRGESGQLQQFDQRQAVFM